MNVKNTKHFFTLLLLWMNSCFSWAQDTIQQTERISRSIPVNFRESYTGKEYIYVDQKPPFILLIKQWFKELLYSFLQQLGIAKNALYYVKLIFYCFVTIAAVYIIARMFFYKEGTWIFRKNKINNPLSYQSEVETIETSNFEVLIQNAVKEENYRLSVKFHHLWTLQKLSEKGIIELSNLKTTIDYQLETEETPYHKNFKNVSYYYTYVWYGEFAIDADSHQQIATKYQQFLKDLS
ncbi:hypothetical protein Q4548_03200 [Wenyingzhuangia sp. 2_MG-2023]|nr:hypothetical protein [Wenyingzhuangia sp. 2_MG-2023]